MANIQLTTATSGTVTAMNTQQDLTVIHDAGATIALTTAFPSNPINGQSFTLCSVGGITTLTLTTVVGAISNILTTMTVGGAGTWKFYGNKWYKTN
jgi:hypothetical protein